jgi:hypothetical protein
MSEHTPGPWQIGPRDGDNLPILDAAGNYLGLADFENVANNADRVDANARLIAAAPDLLTALIACHAKIASAEAIADLYESNETKDAYAAIVKATNV